MKIKNYLCFTFLFFSLSCRSNENREQFYSLAFLRNHIEVRKALKKIGFKPISIKTPDNFNLSGLFLSRPNATCNVIVCAGWFPGRKEGMATFYALLPEYCNILLFDARGRGESEGMFLWNIWRYGTDEYRDVMGAISWLNNNNSLPIIIGGTCSGVFNAAHAIIQLINNNAIEQSRVKGLFFDSGWGSVMTMSQSSALANIKKYFTKVAVLFHGSKKNIDKNIFYKICCSCIFWSFKTIHYLSVKPVITQYEKITNLFDKIHQITLPILFIHSRDDTHAIFSHAHELAMLAPHKQFWWIEKSSHAKHHLIHKDTYKEKLIAFIEYALHHQ